MTPGKLKLPYPHISESAFVLYGQALLTEELYLSGIFAKQELSGIPIWKVAEDGYPIDFKVALTETIKLYPFLEQAITTVETRLNIPNYHLRYWTIVGAIECVIKQDPESWRAIIYNYETVFLGQKQ